MTAQNFAFHCLEAYLKPYKNLFNLQTTFPPLCCESLEGVACTPPYEDHHLKMHCLHPIALNANFSQQTWQEVY